MKYYTPEIEEFHVGFECEFKNNMQSNYWEKEICDVNTILIVYDSLEHGSKEWDDDFEDIFRVKYLDQQDIESLGWISTNNHSIEQEFKKGYPTNYLLWWDTVEHALSIINNLANHIVIGKITIKNKSELRRLLKQLGI